MIVKILRESRRLKGKVSDDVECDAALGNHLACLGYVKILRHESAKGPSAKVVRSGKERVKDELE